MSKSIPQLTAKSDIQDADLFHIVRDNVDYKKTDADIFDPLRYSAYATDYDAGTTYEVAEPASSRFAMYDGVLWEFIGASPTSGVTPGTDDTKWQKVFCARLGHFFNEDTALAQGTANEVTAADIRSDLDTYKAVKLVLTDTEVKNLFSTPVTLILGTSIAPGQAVELISASLFLDYNSAAYGNIDIVLGHAAAANNQMSIGLGVMNATSDKFVKFSHTASGGLTQIIEDAAIVVSASALSATGNSPVTIYAYYRIITL